MAKAEPMVLCPVCRVAWPDSMYYAHAKTHQKGSALSDCLALLGAVVVVTAGVLVYAGLCIRFVSMILEGVTGR